MSLRVDKAKNSVLGEAQKVEMAQKKAQAAEIKKKVMQEKIKQMRIAEKKYIEEKAAGYSLS